MYLISELAKRVGLSRTTLLYYEKLGLLKGRREANGYRVYTDADRQRLRLLQQLQAGGLSLQECQSFIDGKLDREILQHRLQTLEHEIAQRHKSRDLLGALLGQSSLKDWHEELERVAPDLHRAWLMTQGFSSKEAAQVAWLSKDMNDHERYMADFMHVFSGLDRWGPGSAQATCRALSMVPFAPASILEFGCGNGVATLELAEQTTARITATDTAEGALDKLREMAVDRGLEDRIEARALDMAQLPPPDQPYDLIWAEGCIYIIGVGRALELWRPMLQPGGALVFSDMVWRTEAPSDRVQAFWVSEYPAMATLSHLLEQAKDAGYRVLGHFDMGNEAMDAYYRPLEARLDAVQDRLVESRAFDDLQTELSVWREAHGQFGFEMFVLQRP